MTSNRASCLQLILSSSFWGKGQPLLKFALIVLTFVLHCTL